MDFSDVAALTIPPDRVLEEVADLATYPGWLRIVHSAVPAAAADSDPGPAWTVEIGAKIGLLPATKKLRMARTHLADVKAGGIVTFERHELDGKDHSPWILTAEVAVTKKGSQLTMHLHYGGSLWVPGLDRILRAEVERAGPRLERRLAVFTLE